jgi:alcohol dehydrogenase class IV
MHAYIEAHSHAFDPDEIRILVAALDKAWESVQASGAKFDTDAHAETARAIIAKHIVEAAKHGERDQGRLRDGALVAFTQANLRTAPRHSGARRASQALANKAET